MAGLFPDTFGTNTITEEEVSAANKTVTGYKKSVYFDFKKGDLLLDGSKKIIECTPFEAWVQWCQKVVQTNRFKCEAYSTDIGIDTSDVIGISSRSEVEDILTSEISEALAADPYGRTDYVESIEYNWIRPDAVEATIHVLGRNQTTATFTTTVSL